MQWTWGCPPKSQQLESTPDDRNGMSMGFLCLHRKPCPWLGVCFPKRTWCFCPTCAFPLEPGSLWNQPSDPRQGFQRPALYVLGWGRAGLWYGPRALRQNSELTVRHSVEMKGQGKGPTRRADSQEVEPVRQRVPDMGNPKAQPCCTNITLKWEKDR